MVQTAKGGHPVAIEEIDVLWINAGLSCDGDTIAMTAATQPSVEDLVRGGLPWIPKVHFHNLFLAYENGDEFLERFHRAAAGALDPFILGELREQPAGAVLATTQYGGSRMVDMLVGDPLPRIC